MAGLTHHQHCIPLLTTCLNFPDSFTSVPSLAHAEHRLYQEASEMSGWEEKAQVKPGTRCSGQPSSAAGLPVAVWRPLRLGAGSLG